MKKHFLALFLFAFTGLSLYFLNEKYDSELQNVQAEKIFLKAANEKLAEQLTIINVRVDSLSFVSEDQEPIDLARITEILKQSVYKIIVWSKKEDSTHNAGFVKDTIDESEYDIKTGTAFCIFEDNILITNQHVIGENAEFALLVDYYDQKIPVNRVVLMSGNLDYAIIRADGLEGKPLDPTENEIAQGIQIVTMGNPLELDFTPSVGWITALRLNNNVLQISNPITHGNSGGPVINKYGQLLGLIYGGYQNNAMLNFAVNIHAVMHDIEIKSGISILPDSTLVPEPLHHSIYDVMGIHTQFKPEVANLDINSHYEKSGLPQIQYGRLARQ